MYCMWKLTFKRWLYSIHSFSSTYSYQRRGNQEPVLATRGPEYTLDREVTILIYFFSPVVWIRGVHGFLLSTSKGRFSCVWVWGNLIFCDCWEWRQYTGMIITSVETPEILNRDKDCMQKYYNAPGCQLETYHLCFSQVLPTLLNTVNHG